VTGVSPATPAPRTARLRVVAAAVLIVLALALALDLSRFSPLQAAWFDAYERISPRTADTTPVTVVAIDDRSLERFGRWPWPRNRLAELVLKIAAFSPAAIGLDIVMPEPDSLSPERALASIDVDAALRARIAALPSNDARLAAALRVAPTVLAIVGASGPTSQPLHATPPAVARPNLRNGRQTLVM